MVQADEGGLNHEYMAQPGRLRRPGRGLKTEEKISQQPISKSPHTQKSGHPRQGLCLFAKRLERGHFVWPQATSGAVSLTSAQLSMLLEGIDWRMPQRTWQPETLKPPQLAA
jgi:transposase